MITPERDTLELAVGRAAATLAFNSSSGHHCHLRVPCEPCCTDCANSIALIDASARLERARVVLQESATRIDILLLRGDLGADKKDEQTTKRWLSRVRKALADIPAPAESSPVAVEGEKEWRSVCYAMFGAHPAESIEPDEVLPGCCRKQYRTPAGPWIDADVQASKAHEPKKPLSGRAYTELMEKTAARVNTWPAWKVGERSERDGYADPTFYSSEDGTVACSEPALASEAPKGNE